MTEFTIIKPDDMHVHLRDGDILNVVAPYTSRQFARALIMPNLVPPCSTVEQAKAYKDKIEQASGTGFTPLMTLYLTDNISVAEIEKAAISGFVKAVKLYPAGATTNSDSGVTNIEKIYPILEVLEKTGLLFLVHGEVTDKEIDIFDREAIFIEKIMQPVAKKFPNLKTVFEHITTKQAADFVTSGGANIAATITPHHLLFNRNHMLVGGVRPHYYCLPILKREEHRAALVKAALSGNKKFFAGTDSAPHIVTKKETSCGCAGCFNAPNAVEFYAQCFDENENLALEETQIKFENFMSKFGADFYGLNYNNQQITLTDKPQKVAESVDTPQGKIIPLMANETLKWSVK
jgi:dihydroorotase